MRGRMTLNSVNSPGFVSTSIDPACCLTIMSWLNERPRPVPSPGGLVVKKGLNIFSFTSGGIPMPLSRILISTLAEVFRRGSEGALITIAIDLDLTLRRRVKAVGNQVQKHPRG